MRYVTSNILRIKKKDEKEGVVNASSFFTNMVIFTIVKKYSFA